MWLPPINVLAPNPALDAARGVLQRTIGGAANRFNLSVLPARADGLDAFSIDASNGTVNVAGTSAVAICRAAYEYLKEGCHVQVSWNGGLISVPKVLPDYAKRDVVGPNKYRHYFNICTFGYTTVWWDWKRWEKEIDWMALHGINMPLAMTGQEAVWQKTFRSFGIPDASIAKFFSGPAYLPWHWMGNLNTHMGPLSQNWIDSQAKLQKQILGRERSLGMKPVVPGFSGFVPTDFSKFHPEVKLSSPTAWCNFEPTTFVDVRSPVFVQIGKKFIQEYRKTFGSDHLYLCDTFNEQLPQFAPETEKEDLAASGRSVITAIREADPEGVWIMQGWLFYNAANYWSVPRVEALMRDVQKDIKIILDLATNESALWKRLPPVRKMGWIYNTLHNYGQSTGLYGNLQNLANRAHEDLVDPSHGNLLGAGLTPEGIEQNPVVYELMTDMMWTRDKVSVPEWLDGYVKSRYGDAPPEARKAWAVILESIYGQELSWYRAAWRGRPGGGRADKPPYDAKKLQEAVRLLLECKTLRTNLLYQRDLVDVTKTWLGTLADMRLASSMLAFDYDKDVAKDQRARFFGLLNGIDEVMATRSEHRLSTWINDAKKWGKSDAERAQMEENARAQVTVWGRDVLFDYANKEWAGLNKDFIQGRWHLYFDALDKAGAMGKIQMPDFAAWELAWTNKKTAPMESKPGDAYDVSARLFSQFGGEATEIVMPKGIDDNPGIAVGKPVRDSGHTESGHSPRNAVDGHVLGGYWAASPAPQWLEIDLEKSHPIAGVTIYPYFGDARSYQYTIEVSSDREKWTVVADGRNNTAAATLAGYKHEFAAMDGRYVRVTMVKNSANPGVHLQEVRVFEK